MRRTLVLLAALSGLVLGSGCGPDFMDGGGGQGPGHRPQYLGLTPQQEFELGRKADEQVLKESRAKGILLADDSVETKRVQGVGRKIEAATANQLLLREINLRVQKEYLSWEYHVLKSDQINAFCLPGGRVFVFTGLLGGKLHDGQPVVENDDQLATVMGHEIAHALAHHASERVAREGLEGQAHTALDMQELGSVDSNVVRRLMGALAPGWVQLNLGGSEGLGTLAFDRAQESEADHIGLFLMTFASYDPRQTVVFWERMMEANRGPRPPEILSDHPSDARRIHQLREWVPEAKGAKRAYDARHNAPAAGE
jgi:metalloendopeptidase OMA1, mitochondrial